MSTRVSKHVFGWRTFFQSYSRWNENVNSRIKDGPRLEWVLKMTVSLSSTRCPARPLDPWDPPSPTLKSQLLDGLQNSAWFDSVGDHTVSLIFKPGIFWLSWNYNFWSTQNYIILWAPQFRNPRTPWSADRSTKSFIAPGSTGPVNSPGMKCRRVSV